MNIKKSSWILVGIFLWGIPTAIFLSLLLAVKKPGSWDAQDFQMATFTHSLILTIPTFILFGVLYGLWMNGQMSKKS